MLTRHLLYQLSYNGTIHYTTLSFRSIKQNEYSVMKSMMSLIILVINIGVGFHAVLNGNWFIAAVCAIFGAFCFIDLKESVV